MRSLIISLLLFVCFHTASAQNGHWLYGDEEVPREFKIITACVLTTAAVGLLSSVFFWRPYANGSISVSKRNGNLLYDLSARHTKLPARQRLMQTHAFTAF